ncbi:MAG: response regulator transcription factor [Bryobacteraceae bacterium]
MTTLEQKVTIGICDTQPMIVEGLRYSLEQKRNFHLIQPARSLDEAFRVVLTLSPRVMVIDKAFGSTAVLDWVTRVKDRTPSSIVIWSSAMTESEALRFIKVGAKGVVRKSAETGSIVACIESVAAGRTWLEDSLFREGRSEERGGRTELTLRENQVLELVEQGLRNKEIANELGIMPGTVKIHLKHIFEKTGVRGRYGLALCGLQQKASLRWPCKLGDLVF